MCSANSTHQWSENVLIVGSKQVLLREPLRAQDEKVPWCVGYQMLRGSAHTPWTCARVSHLLQGAYPDFEVIEHDPVLRLGEIQLAVREGAALQQRGQYNRGIVAAICQLNPGSQSVLMRTPGSKYTPCIRVDEALIDTRDRRRLRANIYHACGRQSSAKDGGVCFLGRNVSQFASNSVGTDEVSPDARRFP